MNAELTTASDLSRTRHVWSIIAVPVTLAVLGVVLRYLGYLSVADRARPQGFVDSMCVWDCYWYGDIAAKGYQAYPEQLNFGGPAGIANRAFFTLYPLLIAGVQRLTGATPAMLGAIVTPVQPLGAALASWPLFAGDRRAYFLFAAFLLAGPFSFYFAVLYSESLFLLLTVLALVALQRRSFIAAGAAGALQSATRTVGVLFVFAILTEALAVLWPRLLRDLPRRPDIVLALLLAPLGLFAFMVWLYLVTGDALAFVHIQRAWDRALIDPAVAIWAALTSPGGQTRDAPLLALASLVGLGLCGALVWTRRFPAAVFTTLCLLLALTNGVESMLRFVVALAPLGIMACLLLARRRWLFWLSLAAFLALGVVGTRLWINQQGALM